MNITLPDGPNADFARAVTAALRDAGAWARKHGWARDLCCDGSLVPAPVTATIEQHSPSRTVAHIAKAVLNRFVGESHPSAGNLNALIDVLEFATVTEGDLAGVFGAAWVDVAGLAVQLESLDPEAARGLCAAGGPAWSAAKKRAVACFEEGLGERFVDVTWGISPLGVVSPTPAGDPSGGAYAALAARPYMASGDFSAEDYVLLTSAWRSIVGAGPEAVPGLDRPRVIEHVLCAHGDDMSQQSTAAVQYLMHRDASELGRTSVPEFERLTRLLQDQHPETYALAERYWTEGKANAGPYAAVGRLYSGVSGSSNASALDVGVKSASGNYLAGATVQLSLVGPAKFVDGGTKTAVLTADAGIGVPIHVTGPGEVTLITKLMGRSRAWPAPLDPEAHDYISVSFLSSASRGELR